MWSIKEQSMVIPGGSLHFAVYGGDRPVLIFRPREGEATIIKFNTEGELYAITAKPALQDS